MQNIADIASNAAEIAANDVDIQTNADNIDSNADDIDELHEKIENLTPVDECEDASDCSDPTLPRCDTDATPNVCAALNGQCPEGTIDGLLDVRVDVNEDGSSCLMFNEGGDSKRNFPDAMKFCSSLGGRLYEPVDQTQFDNMQVAWEDDDNGGRGSNADGWIGVSNIGSQENAADWVYATRTGTQVPFVNWKGGSPTGGFLCVYFQGNNGKWLNDEDCDSETQTNNFVCEF